MGRFLAGETVEAESADDGLVSIFHRGVLVATLPAGTSREARAGSWQRGLRARPRQTKTTGITGHSQGGLRGRRVSFAGTGYRVGNALAAKTSKCAWWETRSRSAAKASSSAPIQARHDRAERARRLRRSQGRPRKMKAS